MADLRPTLAAPLLAALLAVLAGLPGEAQEGPETAGWHLIRPGETFETISQEYLRRRAEAELRESNPDLAEPRPGERVLVQLNAGLPAEAAIVRKLAGRVDAQPEPIPWLRSRRFDLLRSGDGLRTFAAASVEMFFSDRSRLVLSEDTLVFLRDRGAEEVPAEGGEIEILDGQADLKRKARAWEAPEEAVEIVMGPARVRSKADAEGLIEARARRTADGDSQLMVYRGESSIEVPGASLRVVEGRGSVIPAGGVPTPPELLLPAPELLGPSPGATLATTAPRFRWNPVPKAAGYTFELCLDPDCGELVHRRVDLPSAGYDMGGLSPGRYYWRVTPTAASGLDGFPSPGARLVLEAREPVQVAAASPGSGVTVGGSVRSRADATPLAGATVRLLEPEIETASGEGGGFAFLGVPAGTYTMEVRLPGFAIGRVEDVSAHPERPTDLLVFLDPAPLAYDEIVVRSSRVSLMSRDAGAPFALDRDAMEALPHLGDDVFRAVPLLPGATANDVSAQFHVRGGRRDEVGILLDGQELYGAFHLKDFDNALSIVAPSALGNLDLSTGGFAAQHGERMGAILDMTLLEPPFDHRYQLGASLLSLQAGMFRDLPGDRGSFLAIARRGSIDLAGKVFGKEDPSFWDVLAKGTLRLTDRQSLSLRVLHADDSLDILEVDGQETHDRRTRHDASYLWLTHQALLSSRIFVDTFASWSELDSERRAQELEEEQQFDVLDRRSLEALEIRQDWRLQATAGQLLSWGLGARRFEAPYDYFSFRNFDTPIAAIRAEPEEGTLEFADRVEGEHTSAYLSDSLRRGKVSLEVGARFDRQSWLDDQQVSPRANLAVALGEAAVLRASWGLFHQSLRPNELQVEDGRFDFTEPERTEQALVGFEKVFREGSGPALRVEAYARTVRDPRRRFENLYEPFNVFPELEPDRFLFEPERSRSRGVEVFLRGPAGKRVGWWANYAWSRAEDRIDGAWIPRQIDQTHTLNLNLDFPIGKHWRLNAAWRAHTGWPTTPLSLEAVLEEPEDGEEEEDPETVFVPVLGRINSERLGTYHRLDVRASREFRVRKGELTFFIDIQNVYNRKNLSGFDHEVDEELGLLIANEELWPGIFPSVGFRWEF